MFNHLFSKKKEKGFILNQRATFYLDEVFPVCKAIENGRGRIKAHDHTSWVVEGDDCPINTMVRVVDIGDNGIILKVIISSSFDFS